MQHALKCKIPIKGNHRFTGNQNSGDGFIGQQFRSSNFICHLQISFGVFNSRGTHSSYR